MLRRGRLRSSWNFLASRNGTDSRITMLRISTRQLSAVCRWRHLTGVFGRRLWERAFGSSNASLLRAVEKVLPFPGAMHKMGAKFCGAKNAENSIAHI